MEVQHEFSFRKKANRSLSRRAARIQPENEPPFEAKMKVSLLKAYLLKPGVRVQVKYDPMKKEQVTMDDEAPAILERNPQLKK